MTRDLETAQLDTPVDAIARAMQSRGISGVPVLGDGGAIVGVVTRVDLLGLGVVQAGLRATSPAMPLPKRVAREVMVRRDPVTIASAAPMRDAARLMVAHEVHRVFVLDDDKLVGVVCAVDVARAVSEAQLEQELSTIMTTPIATIDLQTPLGAAVELLEKLRVTGLIVTDDGLPVGMFTQADALAARDLPRSTPTEVVYDPSVICLPAQTKLPRAAAHASQLDVRRVVVCKARDAVGIVSALDFAKFVATA